MMRDEIVGALMIAALPLGGCDGGHECNLNYVQSGVAVVLESPSWAAARYEVELTFADHAVRCTLDVAQQGTVVQQDAGASPNCVSEGFMPEDDGIYLRVVPEIQLFVPATPDSVRVRVARDGELLHEATYEPRYVRGADDPPRCEGYARNGRIEVSLP